MAAQNPPVNGVAYTVYIALQDMANPGSYKANPTLAAGDAQVSIDGGAFNNLATLPAVAPAAGVGVRVVLSAAEMTGDNILVKLIDQTATKEWADYAFTIQTVAAVWLAPTTAGRTLDVSAAGNAGIDWANIDAPTTAQNLSGTNIDTDQVVASVAGAVGSVTGAVGSVAGNVGGNVNGSVGSVVGAVGSVTAPVTVGTNNDKTGYGLSAAAVQAIWDALTAALTTVGSIGKLIVDNLNAPTGSVPTAIQNADALLTRDLTAVAAPAARSPFNALRKLINRVALAAPTLTIYAEDDATPAYTQTVVQDAAQTPIKSVDTN